MSLPDSIPAHFCGCYPRQPDLAALWRALCKGCSRSSSVACWLKLSLKSLFLYVLRMLLTWLLVLTVKWLGDTFIWKWIWEEKCICVHDFQYSWVFYCHSFPFAWVSFSWIVYNISEIRKLGVVLDSMPPALSVLSYFFKKSSWFSACYQADLVKLLIKDFSVRLVEDLE